MLQKLRVDYARYSRKRPVLWRMCLMMLADAGFRAVVIYRAGYWCRKHRMKLLAGILERMMHHLCHCWISTHAEIGEGFLIAHVGGIIVGGQAQIGKNCDIRQNVTLGGNFNKKDEFGRTQPIISDNVSICAGAIIVGPVKVGCNAIIGANSVVSKDVPDNMIVSGIPAKPIRPVWNVDSGRQL